jgi:hypothetical protein
MIIVRQQQVNPKQAKHKNKKKRRGNKKLG